MTLSAGAAAAEGFVLSGGQSRRMGTDKALVELEGRPLIEHVLQTMRSAGLNARIAGARSPLAAFAPVILDKHPDLGPLGGVCSSLRQSKAEFAVFASVDTPRIPASLLLYLMHHAIVANAVAVVPSVNGFPQTFPAVIHRHVLPTLELELHAGRAGCFSAFAAAAKALQRPLIPVPVELLVQAGQISHPAALPPTWWFCNVNTPADLHRLQTCARRPHRVS